MNPDMITKLMPFLAGMGFPVLMGNIEKLNKIFTGGGAKAKAGQQPAGPAMGAASGPQGMPPAGGLDPQKMMLIMQIMKARGMA